MVPGLHLLFPSLARLGWLTTRLANPPRGEARATAFLFRGQAAIFSRSFGEICDRLRAAGIWAEDCRCTGDRWACRHLAAERAARRPTGPVILIGHSRGGRRAVAAAARLAAVGIDVDLLVGIDVAFAPPVPGNVRHAIHLFRSAYRLYPARPLAATPGAPAVVENIDLDAPDAPFPGRGLHHLNITRAEPVRHWVVRQVLRELS